MKTFTAVNDDGLDRIKQELKTLETAANWLHRISADRRELATIAALVERVHATISDELTIACWWNP